MRRGEGSRAGAVRGTGSDMQNKPRLGTFEWVGPGEAPKVPEAGREASWPSPQALPGSRPGALVSRFQAGRVEGCGEPGLGRMPGTQGGAPWGLAETEPEVHGGPALGGSVT